MVGQCVTIAGDTASGKKTLIRRLLCDPAARAVYGVASPCFAYGPSFAEALPDVVEAEAVLNQWQWRGGHARIAELLHRWPRAAHKVIVLRRDFGPQVAAYNARFPRSHWKDAAGLAAQFEREIRPTFESLAWEVPVEWWDPTTDRRIET